jgi:hypothetical protein
MKRINAWPFVLFTALAVPLLVFAFPDPPARNTGAPGDGSCAGCHNGVLNSGAGKAVLNFPGALTYTPGVTQHLSVTVSDPTEKRWAFQLTARLASNLSSGQAGSFTATDTVNTHVICDGGSCASPTAVQFMQNTSTGTRAGTTGSSMWTFDWAPPSSNVGNVAFYLIGMGATNNGGTNGDNMYTATYTLTPAAATPPPTLSASPSSLNFTYQQGGSVPPSQSISVTSSGTALTFVATSSGGSWLSALALSVTTPGTVSVSVNPAGLAPGTYNGTVTITSAGAAGSPQTAAVKLVVSAGNATSSLAVSPSTLQFTYQTGGLTPPSQSLMITSTTSTSLSYSAAATTQSGGSWLTVGPASGTTPGSVTVLASPSGLAAGTFNGTVTITSSGAVNSPQIVPVTLTVSNPSPTSGSSLIATPSSLTFSEQGGGSGGGGEREGNSQRGVSHHKSIKVTSNGGPLNFTVTYSGSPWLSVSPAGGTTPGFISVSVNSRGMHTGSYSGTIELSAPGSQGISVPVTLSVTGSSGGGGDSGEGGSSGGGGAQASGLSTQPYVYDPTSSGAVAAQWVDHIGAPVQNGTNGARQGLLLSKNATAPAEAQAGVIITNAEGLTLTELGFDVRDGGQCSAISPHFVVVTTDGAVHVVGGCGKGTTLPAPVIGWKRMRFDPSKPDQASPPITPGEQVKSLAVIVDQGPESGPSAAGGLVVLDNIDINGVLIGKQ